MYDYLYDYMMYDYLYDCMMCDYLYDCMMYDYLYDCMMYDYLQRCVDVYNMLIFLSNCSINVSYSLVYMTNIVKLLRILSNCVIGGPERDTHRIAIFVFLCSAFFSFP